MFIKKNNTPVEGYYDRAMREQCSQLLMYANSMSTLFAEIQASKLVADCFICGTPDNVSELQHIEKLRHSMRCAAGAYDTALSEMRRIQREHLAELSPEWSAYNVDKSCHDCLRNIAKNYK